MEDDSDRIIRETIRSENEQLAKAILDEPSLTEVIVQSFRGRRRWLTIFPFLLSLLYAGLMFWSGYQFFVAETTKAQIGWATGFLAFAISVGLIKIWVWGEWQHNSLAREIKRLELAIVDLRKHVES